MRSLLLVSADSKASLDLAATSGADVVVVDLGKLAAPSPRDRSRARAAAFLAARPDALRAFVRIAPLSSELAAGDLDAIVAAGPDGIFLPGATSGADIVRLAAMLRPREAVAGMADGATRIIAALADTPAALFALGTYGAANPRLAGLAWNAADLAEAVGAEASRDADGKLTDLARIARALTLAAAVGAGVTAIDTLFDDTRDLAGLEAEAMAARRAGYAAKLASTADQVAVINRVFTSRPAATK